MRLSYLPILLASILFVACGTDPGRRVIREEDTGAGAEDTAVSDGSSTEDGSGSDATDGSGSDASDGSGSGDTTADTDPADTTLDTDPADTTADTDPADTTADTDPADTTADTDPADTTIPPGCGDGIVQSGEGCDDGNSTPGDGCSPACAVEFGFVCTGLPSRCTERCAEVICIGGDACNVSSCNPANGLCEEAPRADGTACDDGNLCSTGDVCTAGVCGGREVVCPAGDGCSVGTCNPASGRCEGAPAPDCTACGDGNFCAGGVCGGVPTSLTEGFGTGAGLSRFLMSGTQPWTFDAAGGRTGGAMRSGVISNSSTSVATLTQTLATAATLTFWYRVSSEASYDFLRVTLDGTSVVSASGTVAWTQVTRSLAAGTHTLVFTYSKDSTTSAGSDAAWIDDLAITSGIGGTCVSDGCGTSLFDGSACVVCGALPNGTSCPGGGDCTEAICDAGRCTEVTVPDGSTCGAGGTECTPTVCEAGACVEQAAADCTACGTDGLCGGGVCRGPNELSLFDFESDAQVASFTTGGSAGWTRTTLKGYASSSSFRSGAIGSSTTSTASITVTNPTETEMRFWVATSTESCCDRLTLTINGVVDAQDWGGEANWTEVVRTLPAGTSTITFTYRKDGSVIGISDAVWIDNLSIGGGGGSCGTGDGCGTPIWNGSSCITCNPQPEGTVCEADASDCVIGTCRSGACAPGRAADGTVCDGDASDCRVGTCRTGLCNVVNATNGTVCDSDTSDCQVGACSAGTCSPSPVPNGTSCDADSTDCTRDSCQAGSCRAVALSDCTTCGADGSGLCGSGTCQGDGGTTNGFETDNDLSGFVATTGYDWLRDTTVARSGRSSLRTPTNTGSFTSTFTQTIDLAAATDVSFWYKVSNVSGYDYLYFYLDGNYYGGWTGEVPWTEYTVSLAAGTHTLQFYYYQYGTTPTGASAAWIDDLTRLSTGSCASDECGRWVSGDAGCRLCETVAPDCTSCGTDSACMAGRCGGVEGVILSENFSSATRPAGFSVDSYPWVVDTTGGRTGGAYASAIVPYYYSSTSTLSFTAAGNATLTFWYKLNGYSGYDSFYAYLDGTAVIYTSYPTSGWVQATVPVTPGNHALQFYFYNGYYSSGTDRAWVDDIRIVDAGGCTSDACGLGLFDGTVCNTCPLLSDGSSCDTDTTDCDSAACTGGVCVSTQQPDCTSCGATGTDLCIAGACGGLPAFPLITFDSATDGLADFVSYGSVTRSTATGTVREGAGSMRLGPVVNYGSAGASITVDTPAAGTLSFWRKSGLATADAATVSIDGLVVNTVTGVLGWDYVTLPIAAGQHIVDFTVSAGYSATTLTDRSVYIDSVAFSAYPSCPASNTCVYSGYDGAGCVACDTGACGP